MWELDCKWGWVLKNWCIWTLVLEKNVENTLYSKEIKQVNPKQNQPLIFIGRTDAEAPTLWKPLSKSWLIGKDPNVGKDRRQEEKGMTEDEMVGWHHWLNQDEFEQTPGDGEEQGSLEWWGTGKPGMTPYVHGDHKQLDMTEWLTEKKLDFISF